MLNGLLHFFPLLERLFPRVGALLELSTFFKGGVRGVPLSH